jgi:hypothetical protein
MRSCLSPRATSRATLMREQGAGWDGRRGGGPRGWAPGRDRGLG